MPTVDNSSSLLLRERKCFCPDCKGKLQSLNIVKRHPSLFTIRGKGHSLSLFGGKKKGKDLFILEVMELIRLLA